MLQHINTILNPERFQGHGKSKSYFEGWYFKLVSASGRSLAIIPGIAWDMNGEGFHGMLPWHCKYGPSIEWIN